MDERYAQETQTLRELLALMHEHDLQTLKVKLGDAVYELSRRGEADGTTAVSSALPGAAEQAASALAPADVIKVLAPLTGVFYRASSPDSTPFVDVGDRVEPGDVICVLEAMKLFNEIQSDDAGTIARVLPDNGQLVSQGDELFWIQR